MCSESIFVAGRYNKYLRNLSQSPWIDKDDVRIKHSVQELIEDGLKQYLRFDKSVFSSSGREDVDVRMLGKGRPFVFRLVNPWGQSLYNQETMRQIQRFVNEKHSGKIRIRDLQVVSKEGVSKNIKEGQESKKKEYRALCCCSKILTTEDMERISNITDFYIDQKTPIRVLHRRTLTVRRRKIYWLKLNRVKEGDYDIVKPENLPNLFVLNLLTEAGTYIKEFVHGDFGRTEPNLSAMIGDCETDLMELDVMEVDLDWPPSLVDDEKETDICPPGSSETMDKGEMSLTDLYTRALKAMRDAEVKPRGAVRQDLYNLSRHMFEQASDLIESLSLFSDNETIEDVATNDLKYMLVPAYLAKISISSECGPDRLGTFIRASILLKSFLQRVMNYGLGDDLVEQAIRTDDTATSATNSSLEFAMQSRDAKIEKYKKMKMLETRLDELERRFKLGQGVDESDAREYYLSLIRKWINDSLESLEREVKPALFFERNRSLETRLNQPSSSTSSASSGPQKSPPKTMTIVKDELQKQVFGLGYPSRPTVTVDEFIGKKIADGDLAFHAQKEVYANSLQRYAEKPDLLREQEEASDAEHDEKADRDDVDELIRRRQWDEFKDDNPRGSGNRHNMG